MKQLKRREFIRLSSVVAIGTGLFPGAALSQTAASCSADYDVIIIGAGLAGLTAALRLEQAGITNILILEAKDRVGGRTMNISVNGGYVAEGGGQWIGPGQTAIYDLMEELSISSFPSYQTGTDVNASSLTNNQQEDYDNAISQLNEMASTIPISAPWDAPNAEQWDAMTLEDWMNANMTTINGFMELYGNVSSFLSADPSEISLLYFLFYVNSAGSVTALTDDAQQERITGGAQAISLALATNINAEISLNSMVSSINDLGNELEVTYDSTVATARKVIVAMMPKDVSNISFPSGLNNTRQELQSNWVGASGVKVSLVYDSPFWRDEGFSGTAYGTDLFFVTDNSPEDASSGILVGFPGGNFMSLPADEREQAAKNELETFFGPDAQSTIDYVETVWDNDPSIGGCVSPLPPGVLTNYGSTLRIPEGNVHWAGTETSELWTGYMDGAIRSGERAAQEVLALITGVEEVTKNQKLHVHPTQFSNEFTIEVPGENWELRIYDRQGRLVIHEVHVSKGKQQIDMSTHGNGVYSVALSKGKQVLHHHVIKQP